MEYLANQVRFVEIVDVIKVGDTYQEEGCEENGSNDRRSYPAKKVRYERRTGVDASNQYVHSVNIKA